MVRAQLTALLYWPDAEFMKRVFTTSTGDATTVVQKPAPKAAVKWHGRSSGPGQEKKLSGILQPHFQQQPRAPQLLTCHQAVLEDQLLDQVVGHQLGAVYDRIAGDVGKTTWSKAKSGSRSHIYLFFGKKNGINEI